MHYAQLWAICSFFGGHYIVIVISLWTVVNIGTKLFMYVKDWMFLSSIIASFQLVT